jgi:hypothetical protein
MTKKTKKGAKSNPFVVVDIFLMNRTTATAKQQQRVVIQRRKNQLLDRAASTTAPQKGRVGKEKRKEL